MDDYNSAYDASQTNLEQLTHYFTSHLTRLNEATTRLHLVDTLLFDCLGWEKQDVLAEEYQRTERQEYTDYTFYAPRRMMILEAKREGVTFEIPAGKVSLTYSLTSICRGNEGLRSAVDQVAGYCQKRGVPIAVVCNGHQLLGFVANRNDGVAPMDGKAIVFSSLHIMLKHFAAFWNCFSRAGIEDGNLSRRLLGTHQPELPPPLSASITGYPGTKGRNVFQSELKHITELVIEDIPESPTIQQDFLKKCYCHSGALSQHSLASKAILRARYSALFDTTSPGRPSLSPATSKTGVSQELYAESMGRRPIVLLGDVGVGKSMFIRHLISIAAVDLFKNAVCLRIDLGTGAALTSDIKDFVVSQIIAQLDQHYDTKIERANFVRGVYNLQLKEFRNSIYGDLAESDPAAFAEKERDLLTRKLANRAEHCKHSLEHIAKARKKQIVMFIDNADQRGDATQDDAFLIAQEVASHWPVLVYVPLRPETFHRSVAEGALSGYHPKAFTVAPPRVDRVLAKRLQYALEVADGLVPNGKTAKQQANIAGLKRIIKSFLKTLHHEDELLECIDNLAGGNIRLALDLVKNFFGSGHVDTKNIVANSKKTLYRIPIHEFLRASIYGDNVYYHPDRSPFANLFAVSANDPREHFLLPVLLAILRQAGHTNKGFVETDELYSGLQGLGFTPEQIDYAVVQAFRKRLIESPASQRPDKTSVYPRMLRATTAGLYHVDRLPLRFAYVDAMVVATPILDPKIRKIIVDVQTVAERFARGEVFQRYLDTCWDNAAFPAISFHWPSASTQLTEDITVARAKSKNRRR